MPWKENARVDVFPYEKAILELRERGYSYGEIATWLTKEVNAPVKRGQVYYVCQMVAAEKEEKFKEAEARGEARILPNLNLSAEEAERRAKEQDDQRRRNLPKGKVRR